MRKTIRDGTFKVSEDKALVEKVRRAKDEDPENVRVEEGVTPPSVTLEELKQQRRKKR